VSELVGKREAGRSRGAVEQPELLLAQQDVLTRSVIHGPAVSISESAV